MGREGKGKGLWKGKDRRRAFWQIKIYECTAGGLLTGGVCRRRRIVAS